MYLIEQVRLQPGPHRCTVEGVATDSTTVTAPELEFRWVPLSQSFKWSQAASYSASVPESIGGDFHEHIARKRVTLRAEIS
jgi:hypothetical protein